MHDVLDPRDLVVDEAEQLASEGYPSAALAESARDAAARGGMAELAAIALQLEQLQRAKDWRYGEPNDEASIFASLDGQFEKRTKASSLQDRVMGAWLGRMVGCTMGKPVEGLPKEEVRSYLDASPGWPGFLPLLPTLPAGVSRLHESAPYATIGNFDAAPRDDDLDWTMLNLHVLERYGIAATSEDFAREWLDRIPFTQTYTAERAAYRNLVHGVAIPATARVKNPYREWIGALIRADIFGLEHPGVPAQAARQAFVDARLSHTGNGIYGEMWAAALVSSALVVDAPEEALRIALGYVPPTSRLHAVLEDVLELYGKHGTADDALGYADRELGHYNWVHTINNAALISIGLLWGGGSLVDSVALTVRGGADTDSDGATVGSVMGALLGVRGVPHDMVAQFHNRARSAVRGFDRIAIDELADRTIRLSGELALATS